MSATPVAVTGASGFVGREVLATLAARGLAARAVLRRGVAAAALPDPVVVGEIGPRTEWAAALAGTRAVIHLAARVHVMDDVGKHDAYHRVNAAGTERLAREAARAGVRRLVFVSSIKVNGEATADAPFRESDPPAPADAYGASKAAAEAGLRRVAAETGLEVVIVRPPLVYGAGVRANFRALMEAVRRGVPLPLGRVRNRRSLVYVGNLADALVTALEHPAAAGETFLVSDGEAVSTPDLVRAIGRAVGRQARLLPVPVALLRAAGTLTGRGAAVERLTGSLVVDSSRIRSRLGWAPPFALEAGLAAAARGEAAPPPPSTAR